MTDVNSNHMAGLLDFMYSGQVNVKYEDLPKFLKVAEIMQIKGLHTEVSDTLTHTQLTAARFAIRNCGSSLFRKHSLTFSFSFSLSLAFDSRSIVCH